MLAFVCVEFSADGGESTLCDGRALIKMLAPTDRAALEGGVIVWEHETSGRARGADPAPVADFPDACGAQADYWVTAVSDTVHLRHSARRTSHPVRWGAGPGQQPDPGLAVRRPALGLPRSRRRRGRADDVERMTGTAPSATVRDRSRDGDVLVIDITRVMHRRTAFSSGIRHILVPMMAA